MNTIEERANDVLAQHTNQPTAIDLYSKDEVLKMLVEIATEQKAIDHSEEHLAWILQEFFKWRESNNPKVSFGEWINVSMEE